MLYRRPVGELLLRLRQGRLESFRKALEQFPTVQKLVLNEILTTVSGSHRALSLGCRPAAKIEDFPIAEYEDIRPWIERFADGDSQALFHKESGVSSKNCHFVTTSGTSGKPKTIPVTPRAIAVQAASWQTWGLAAFHDHKAAAFWDVLPIAPMDSESMSGLTAWKMQPSPFKALYAIPTAAQGIQPFSLKIKSILRLTAANQNLGMIMTANPSTVLMLSGYLRQYGDDIVRDLRDGTFFAESELPGSTTANLRRKLRARNKSAAKRLEQILSNKGSLDPAMIWPNLQLLAMWLGGTLGHYCEALKKPFGHIPWRDHGLVASEGRFTIPLGDNTPEGVLDPTAAWFEFLPLNATPDCRNLITGENLIPGESYQLIVTTHSGLVRYNMHDIVECTGFKGLTPLVAFSRKSQQFSNITGEKISATQINLAIAAVIDDSRKLDPYDRAINCITKSPFLTLAPAVDTNPPNYTLYIELNIDQVPDSNLHAQWNHVCAALDRKLAELNCEYRAKRQSERLGPIRHCLLKSGTLDKLRAQHLKNAPGATPEQFKQPLLWHTSTRPLRDMAFTV